MFSKKPAMAPALWAVRLLTPEYVVDGYSDNAAHPESWPFFGPQGSTAHPGLLWLDGPRFTAVAAGGSVPANVRQWVVPYSSSYVAVLPNDAASLAAARKSAEGHKFSFAAVLTVGPYSIRGQLMSEYEAVSNLGMMAGRLSLAVQEAEIECRLPQSPLAAFKAPLVVVRTQLLQGIGLLG
jgi:hypothetical protein